MTNTLDRNGTSMISGTSISTFLGKNSSPLNVITSAIFVVILFFYVFQVGSYFQVDVSSFENRVNYHKAFLNYIIDKDIDELIIISATALWLGLSLFNRLKIFTPVIYLGLTGITSLGGSAIFDGAVLFSLPVILSLLTYNHFRKTKILGFSENLPLNYLAVLFTVLTSFSLIVSFLPLLSLKSTETAQGDYAHNIFLLFGSFTTVLVAFLILGSSVKLGIEKFLAKLLGTGKKFSLSDFDKISKNKILYLLLIMFFSIVLSLVPHNPAINIDNQVVGSDSGDYVTMLSDIMKSKDNTEFAHKVFVTAHGGDRPLGLLFLYTISKIIPANLSYTVDHVSIILVPALVLIVFFLTRELTSNDKMSLFAAFLTAVSFQTLIGTYGGLYANLFALAIGYLSFVFLFRFLKNSGRANFVVFLSLMVALVYSHVYTWTILTLVMSVFLIIMYKLNQYDKKRIIPAFLVVLISVAIDILRTVLTNAAGGVSQDVSIASHGAGLYQLLLSWNTLTDTMQNYAGGQFGNFIILILCIYWLVRTNLRDPPSILLALFLSIGTLPLLFGNDVIQSRVFFDIPFQIPAGIALTYISKKMNGSILVLPICIWLLSISLKTVTNFYYLSPT